MDAQSFIQTIIGTERTLVITCLECFLDIEQHSKGKVFRYTTLGNIINPNDDLQKESILNFIEFKRCSKIIVAGHTDCKALDYILRDLSSASPVIDLQARLQDVFCNNHGELLQEKFKNKMLVEINVIEQCKILMTFKPIRERLRKRSLSLTGIVINKSGQCKKLFYNGISFNDFISMN